VSVLADRQERLATESSQLATHGYCRFQVTEVADGDVHAAVEPLRQALDELPPDPYGRSRNRYRRYSQAVLLPWCSRLEWIPDLCDSSGAYTEYFQGDYNPEYPGSRRRFASLTPELKDDPTVQQLIWHDFQLTSWNDGQLVRPFNVGVHLVKLLATESGAPAFSSPDLLHQDGEPYTFVHLVARDNAVGATNVIAAPHCSGCRPEEVAPSFILDQFELHEPLDSYGIEDRAVSHYVSEVQRGREPRPGVRAALLIDYTPLAPTA
jgi:hypothetical protein